MSEALHLNFARKWRSKDFDTIIGQDLSVRILKNSLYRGNFFPVYLFAGQRGCGKTTTARVFAAAINCHNLALFQQSPKNYSIPCGQCESCLAMRGGSHPDFIEIDAASHTGVDSVRHIIEACSLVPLLGNKKIYLIDEAHMLSKAAFNAFLKILEEPPLSVIFILATTDPHKIIETVRSRCFKLFFTAVSYDELYKHLSFICAEEQIQYEEEALSLIVAESEGCIRDAINLLEQARFAAPTLTKSSVLRILGKLSDEQMLGMLERVLYADAKELLSFMRAISFEQYNPDTLYEALGELLRVSIWLKYEVSPTTRMSCDDVRELVKKTTVDRLCALQEIVCEYELVFAKTTKKHLMLEMMLLKMVATTTPSAKHEKISAPPTTLQNTGEALKHSNVEVKNLDKEYGGRSQSMAAPYVAQASLEGTTTASEVWHNFLHELDTLGDQWLKSVFAQAVFSSCEQEKVHISFTEQFLFYKDMLQEKEALWLPLLKKVFGASACLMPEFKKNDAASPRPIIRERPATQEKSLMPRVQSAPQKARLDISDGKWQKTDLVMKYFPGTIIEVAEGAS